MRVFRDPGEMRAWSEARRGEGLTIGFVPTMGALHAGHESLLKAAAAHNDAAVLSIFVNPTQFGPQEDFDAYPRTFEADSRMAEAAGVQAIYAPTASSMYPEGYATFVEVERLTEGLCGRSRPGHFRGVATVVLKLLNAVRPHRAYFGRKDAQQLAVIRRMTRDLDLGVEIVPMPTVRESDGLAMSSRNRYLSAEERQRALCLHEGLMKGQALMDAGEREGARVVEAVRQHIEGTPGVTVDYVELVDGSELRPVDRIAGEVLLAVAARVGQARLIDNINYEVSR